MEQSEFVENGRYAHIFENMPLACSLWSRAGEPLGCNKEMLRLLGFDDVAEYLAHRGLAEVDAKRDGKSRIVTAAEMVRAAFETGCARFEHVVFAKDGRGIPVESVSIPIQHEGKSVAAMYLRDISEIADKEQAANELRRYAETLVNMMPMACAVFDENGSLVDCNEETLSLLGGIEKSDYFERFEDFQAEVQPDGRKSTEKGPDCDRVAFEKGEYRFDWVCRTKKGEPVPAEVTLKRFERDGNKYIACYTRDLREILARDAEKREANRRVQLMLDAMPMPCVFWTPQADMIDCNQSTVELFGCTNKQEFLDDFPRFSPEYQSDGEASKKKAADLIVEAGLNGKASFYWDHVTMNGRPLQVHVSLIRVKWDDDFRVVGFLRDISGQRQAEEELATISQIVDAAPRLLVFINKAGEITYASGGAARITGFSRREIRRNGVEGLFGKENADRIFDEYLPKAKECGHVPVEMVVARRDGQKRVFVGQLFAVRLSGGNYNVVYSAEDVTDERRMTLELRQAKLAAEDSAQAKTNFLARMSHEIRTPMNAIIGMTELILRDDVSSTVRDYALSVKQAGRNLLAIINDILDFSKIEAGKMDLVPVEYKTASLINDVVSITRMRIEDKPVAFVANIDANFPETLLGDEVRVRQILINLLSNAAKYTQKGCITLTVTSQEAAPGERMAVFEVKDTGIGIRKENLGKLFNEFTQFDSHKNYATEGTGLGLPISRHLARAMGGDIAVRSKYGKGSIFTATVRQKLPPGPPAPIAHVRDAASKKVLVFENDKIQAHSLAWSFESLGVPFRIAPSKTRLRKALAEENFDFVFVSSALAGAGNKRTLPKAGGARLALMTSQGEGATENPDMPAIQRPLHTIVIANAMNGVPGARSCAEDATPARFTAPEARILVVDDVLSNLKVVEGLLEPFDIGMDFCLDGKEAVYQIRKKDYDFVLMDHMMPGMDGVETVREIRALPGEKYKKLPIIALTANAVSGMKEMFLLNGFDDYISKPIEISKLYRIVEKWTPPEKWVRLASPPPEAAAPAAPGEALDLAIEGVDARRGLALAGGKARVYLEVLRLFGKDADARAETFAKAPDIAGLPDFITHVHALKSAAANVGATKVSNAARFLEEAGKSGDFAAIARRLPAFRRALAALSANIKTALKAVLAQSEADDADIRPATIAAADLAELKDALKRGEVRRADALLDTLRRQPLGKDDKKTLSEISDYVLMSEFEAAIEATAALATSEENE